jgi:hypothetical protein
MSMKTIEPSGDDRFATAVIALSLLIGLALMAWWTGHHAVVALAVGVALAIAHRAGWVTIPGARRPGF